ncbi:MAG TPA: carbon-nitrogen hydrolase family protein [Saprospiraceae bacterium]|nr:carbon-nitrogen hydrolase family protein [Saprospiraceae bacterium]
MKVSIAQIRSFKGNVMANVATHKRMINLAIAHQADVVFFPELSISGYEPELAKELATTQDDLLFDEFQHLSDSFQVTIAAGIPTHSHEGIKISMIILQPTQPRQTYSKQKLHSDELPFFVPGKEQLILKVKNKKIAPAICFESLQNNHFENAIQLGADIYLASVAKPHHTLSVAFQHYSSMAKKFSIPVCMVNSIGFCDHFLSAGMSSLWSKNGLLLGQLGDQNEGLIIFDTDSEEAVVNPL